MDPLAYYATQSPITDPGENAGLFADLPDTIDGLCRVVQGLYIHYQGIPTRTRVGFAAYFTKLDPDFNCSHVVAEFWDSGEKRWRLVDAELDVLTIQENSILFDMVDVPRDQFLVGGKAWQMCRAGESDPNRFGVSGFGEMKGLPFVRGNLIQDLAAQNKMELLNWDCWGLMLRGMGAHTDEELSLLDKVAVLTQAGHQALPEIQAIYEAEAALKMPGVVMCLSPVGAPSEVTLLSSSTAGTLSR